MRVGIIGSRRRNDREKIYALVDSLNEYDVVVSGGCRGPDTWAEMRARQRGLHVDIYEPNTANVNTYPELVERYYDRNKRIVQNSDVIYAFVAPDRKGGTENAIKHAERMGKKVVIR